MGYEFCLTCGHDKWAYNECGKARNEWIANKQKELVDRIEEEMGSLKQLANEQWAKLKTHPLYGNDHKNW
jgi:hypothetical protein